MRPTSVVFAVCPSGTGEQQSGLPEQIQCDVRYRGFFLELRQPGGPFLESVRQHQRVIAEHQAVRSQIVAVHAVRYCGIDAGEWVFARFQPANPDRIAWWWRRARRLAGIDSAWRLHDLRHWSATEAIGSGHDIRTVAGRLGHANAAMTLRVYAHVLERADQAVAATLASALTDQPPR